VASADGTGHDTGVDDPDEAPLLALAEPPAASLRAHDHRPHCGDGRRLRPHRPQDRLPAVFHALGASNPALLAAGYGVAVITILITVRQWHGLSNANGVPCTYRRCLHIELGGDVFDAALPSSIGGDVIRAANLPGPRTSGCRRRRRWYCAACATSPA
jgi:hypothetical protein